MKHVNIDELQRVNIYFGEGSFSEVHQVEYDDEMFAYKKFYDKDFVKKNKLEEKFDILTKKNLKHSVTAEYLVDNKSGCCGYLTKPLNKGDFSVIRKRKDIYETLLRLKESINEIHCNGIIHGDIHSGNVLFEKGNTFLIDFDNCKFENNKGLKPNFKMFSSPAREFIKRNGIIKNLDIYMFNVLTYSLLNGGSYRSSNINSVFKIVKESIINQKYGLFCNKESIKICNDLCNFKANDYLIDTISCKNIERYQQTQLTFNGNIRR